MSRSGTRMALLASSLVLGAGSAAAQEEVNVYSSRHYDTDTQLYERFEQETGIEVNLIEADADELIERIKAEGANTPADVLITVDAGRLWRAEEAGILQPIDSEVLDERIPENLRHPDGLWYGLSKRVRGIVASRERVEDGEVGAYEDLAQPAFDDRVCIRSSSNVYNQSLVASMIESNGLEATEEWANGLVENMARPPAGGDRDQIRAVAAGECDVAVTNHYYLVRMMEGDDEADRAAASKVKMIMPNQDGRGAHANISGAGVVKGAPHEEAAVRFLEYLTTPEAQEYFALGNYEFPVVEDAKLSPALESFGEFKTDTVNAAKLGQNNPEAVKLMDRAGWK